MNTPMNDAPPSESPAETPGERNWRIVRDALLRRINRQRAALQQLSSGRADQTLWPGELAAAEDDAARLLRMLDRTERALDAAFAAHARRPGVVTTSSTSRHRGHHDDYKAQ